MKEQGSKSRLDRIVENAGEKLASRTTRRGFLGKVAGTAGTAVFGGAVILGEKSASEAAVYQGCYNRYETNICYSPYKIINGPAGLQRGPYSAASVLCFLDNGVKFARQSLSTAAPNCYTPGLRPACNADGQYNRVWGYVGSGGYMGWQGWIWEGHLQSDSSWNACGPAGYDFDCTKARSSCPSFSCGGDGNPSGVYAVDSYYQIQVTDLHLRYAPGGTSHHYLVAGDIIHRIRYYGNACAGGWSCVTAWRCANVPYGCHGWIESCYLGNPVSPGGSGGTSCDCPGS